jgi:alkanesulfonate monooxygenase SsuD/methylene tetrahydromethanopterin reductase-like flavin-dependent oxidoreductase (luciferase family)
VGDEPPASLEDLTAYSRTASELGFTWLTANDHVVYARPWLDGPISLATGLPVSGSMTLATTVALPVIRGPGPLAKAMAALDRLSGGRVVVGVGPGSSERDYRAMGIAWEERWPRFDEAVQALRALLRPSAPAFEGSHYATDGMELLPAPARPDGPPIWIGSWGSDAGLRRAARLADGWLASAYNTTPEGFADALHRLRGHLVEAGIEPDGFPNPLVSMFMHVTEDRTAADGLIDDVLAPTLGRAPDLLRERLLVGPAEACAEKVAAYASVGVERIVVWPVGDPLEQLERLSRIL